MNIKFGLIIGLVFLKSKFTKKVISDGGIPNAQWEHTLEITENGARILTKRDNETENNLN